MQFPSPLVTCPPREFVLVRVHLNSCRNDLREIGVYDHLVQPRNLWEGIASPTQTYVQHHQYATISIKHQTIRIKKLIQVEI